MAKGSALAVLGLGCIIGLVFLSAYNPDELS